MYEQPLEKKFQFSQYPDAEDCETLLPNPQNSLHNGDYPRRLLPSYLLTSFIILVLLLTWTLSFWLGSHWQSGPSLWAQQITNYSPILDDVPLTYTTTQFNGSFLKANVYRQPASPEVDEAWAALGLNCRALVVPSDLAEHSNLSPSHVQISPKYGGGYPANVEGLHHLHCLNLLRQSLWYNYPYYSTLSPPVGAFKNPEHILKSHVSHCLDILRQQLMCTVDIGVLGQVWVHPDNPEAFVDFNTRHMCKDFEAVRSWAEKRQMPDEVPDDWLQPPRLGDVLDEIP